MSESITLALFTFLVSLIYSSVGHGGASGYLALLSFFAVSHHEMATSALCLNLLVAGMAFWSFFRASYFSRKLVWPFTVTSVPFAFIGGFLKVPIGGYSLLLAGVLFFASWRLIFKFDRNASKVLHPPSFIWSLVLGGAIGMLSGIVGVGGGIFLSPLMLLFHWADTKHTAAASTAFIFINSLAGLLGKFASHQFQLSPMVVYMVAAAFLGGIIGSRLGANHFSGKWLKRILAAVLLVAALKLLRALVI